MRQRAPVSILCYFWSALHRMIISLHSADRTTNIDKLLARQAGRTFAYDHGLSTLSYSDGGKIRLSVFLLCAETESVKATRNDDTSFFFYVEDKCACPGRCTYTPDGSSGGLGFSAIFVILLVSILAAYLLFGCLFLRFVRHEQGANVIPHRLFWLQTGTDSIGGVRFILSKVTGRQQEYAKVWKFLFNKNLATFSRLFSFWSNWHGVYRLSIRSSILIPCPKCFSYRRGICFRFSFFSFGHVSANQRVFMMWAMEQN